MLESDWLRSVKIIGSGAAIVGFALLLILSAFYAGISSGYFEAETHRSIREYDDRTEQRISQCSGEREGLRIARCVQQAVEANHENRREEQDLEAQRHMAKWAWWLLFVTLLQIPIGIAGFVALLVSIEQGRKGLAHAQRVASAQLRSYVEAHRFRIKKEEGQWRAYAKISNSGIIPAKNVIVQAELTYEEIPLSKRPRPILDNLPAFSLISSRSSGRLMRPVTLTNSQEQKIKSYQAVLLLRIRIAYTPIEGADVEIIEDCAVAIWDDLERGSMRVPPDWMYEELENEGEPSEVA